MNDVSAAALGWLIALAGIIGCALATRVPDEMRSLEKPLRILQGVAGITLLFVLPWWIALIIAGALALGWYPMVLGIGLLAGAGTGTLIAIALPLALLAGARWTLDKRSLRTFIIAVVACTALATIAHFFGVLPSLG